MHLPSVNHTLTIFQQLYDTLPPLVPVEIKNDMQAAMEQIEHNFNLTLEELEDTMIVFGRRIWPYRQAFQEFADIYEGKLGEKFLEQKMSRNLKKRYAEFQAHGGDFRDLHGGGSLDFFQSEERIELCGALISVRKSLRDHVVQAVLSTEQLEYESRIMEFDEILGDIEKRLGALRQIADDEQEHPELAAEIREQIREFEYGLSSLGPHINYNAVCNSADFFHERKLEKKHQIVW
ncbi:MAG: hypothetical protein WC862_02880 [Patescibacteria group bacterium]